MSESCKIHWACQSRGTNQVCEPKRKCFQKYDYAKEALTPMKTEEEIENDVFEFVEKLLIDEHWYYEGFTNRWYKDGYAERTTRELYEYYKENGSIK
jgi:hypothetical protein